jgi:DNA-binding XRE family transcriptional regulator
MDGKLTKQEIAERKARAAEWVGFRKNFPFSQRRLNEILDCSRRTIVSVEGGSVRPHANLLRRFVHLKFGHETERNRHEAGWGA